MKLALFAALSAAMAAGAANDVDLYTPADLAQLSQALAAKHTQFSSEPLQKYGNHYTMLARREATGSSEVHQKESDIFFAVSGNAIIVTGGKLINPRTEKPGELRGTSIAGGVKHALPQGSVIHIPAGTAHQLLIEKGKPFTYFVVKVIE